MVRLELLEVARFDRLLGELICIEPEIDRLASQPWVRRYVRRVGYVFGWADFYELTFAQQLSLLLMVSGQTSQFLDSLKQSNTFGPTLDYVERYEPDFSGSKPKRWQLVICVLLLKALLRNVACISYYSKSIKDLIDQGLGGSPLALRRVVAVDPCVLANSRVAEHLAVLGVLGKRREIREVHAAAVKGPNKQLDPYRRLRYLERATSPRFQ